jgi:hypothetical protein
MQIQRLTATTFEMLHGDHASIVKIADIWHATTPLGVDKSTMQIECTTCNQTIGVPVSGGSDPEGVQRLAVLRAALDETGTKGDRIDKARRKVKKLINGIDPDRWRSEIDDEDDTAIIKIKDRRDQRIKEAQTAAEKWDREAPAREKAERDARETERKTAERERADALAAMQKRTSDKAKEKTAARAIREQERRDKLATKQLTR